MLIEVNEQFYGDGQHNSGVYFWGNLNPYIYTYQTPIKYIDPNGKQTDVTLFDTKKTPADSSLVKTGRNIKNVPNSFTVLAHGNVGYFRDVQNGNKIEGAAGQINNTKMFDNRFKDYKEWNEGKTKKGFSLILYACNTGGGDSTTSLPAKISTDYENISVIAPTRQSWYTEKDLVGVYGATAQHKIDRTDPGYWLVYQKGKVVAAYDATWKPGTDTKDMK